MSERTFTFTGTARRATGKEVVISHKGRVLAEPGDYIVQFDGDTLAFACSPEQFERLFSEKPKPTLKASQPKPKGK